jgi:hypothetical protein
MGFWQITQILAEAGASNVGDKIDEDWDQQPTDQGIHNRRFNSAKKLRGFTSAFAKEVARPTSESADHSAADRTSDRAGAAQE